MKKEVIIAIFLGSFLGLFLGFGFYKANRAVKERAESNNDQTSENELIKTDDEVFENLVVDSPLNNQVLFSNIATISGKAVKNSPIVISIENDDYIAISDEAGNFSQKVTLISGINELTLSQIYKFKDLSEQKLYLIYSTQKFDQNEEENDNK